jgi:CubicO group peptidase (beta-lactamase class C family)
VWIDAPLTTEMMRDLDGVARLLARQKPAWKPGARYGYHAMTIGLYLQEVIRHVDPAHRTLGQFFHDEIAKRLGIEFYIGLPPEIPATRLASMQPLSPGRALRALGSATPELIARVLWPWSLLHKSMLFSEVDWNDRKNLAVEIPAGNGVGTARAIARAYSAFAEGGAELGITPETMARLTAPHAAPGTKDAVLGVRGCYSLGYLRPGPEGLFGSSERAFGTPGAGGSFAFADPDARLGFAYIMNRTDYYLFDDPREKSLRDAVHRAIARAQRPS